MEIALEEESKEKKKDALRGGENLTLGESVQNFMLIAGAAPIYGVKSDTKLIQDVLLTFMQLYDKRNRIVEFPEIFKQLRGSDSHIEIITSSILQNLRMDIVGYQIKDPVVFVFVQTHLQRGDLPKILYDNAEERA